MYVCGWLGGACAQWAGRGNHNEHLREIQQMSSLQSTSYVPMCAPICTIHLNGMQTYANTNHYRKHGHVIHATQIKRVKSWLRRFAQSPTPTDQPTNQPNPNLANPTNEPATGQPLSTRLGSSVHQPADGLENSRVSNAERQRPAAQTSRR